MPLHLIRVKDKNWEDIQRVKTLDNYFTNSIINDGIRLLVKKKMEELFTLKKIEQVISIWFQANVSVSKSNIFISLGEVNKDTSFNEDKFNSQT